MDETEIELGSRHVVDDVVIRPIARRRVVKLDAEPAEGCFVQLEPVGIIVEDEGTSTALDLDGNELDEDVLAAVEDDPPA